MSFLRRHAGDLLAIALLLSVFVAFFGPVIAGRSVFIPAGVVKSDLVNYNLPIREFFAHWVRQGVFPMWTDGYALGFPILAEGEVGHFYLPNWPFYLLIPDAAVAIQWTILSHLLLAMGLTYLLVRRGYSLGPAAAATGALAYTFGAYLLLNIGQANIVTVAAWYPLSLLLLERLLATPRLRIAGWLALVWALQMLAGHISSFVLCTTLLLLYATVRALTAPRAFPRLGLLAGALLLATVIATPQLVPQWELVRLSGHGLKQSERQATSFLFPLSNLAWLVRPHLVPPNIPVGSYLYIEGDQFVNDVTYPWANDTYVGITTLALAAFALRRSNRRVATGLAVLAGIALLFAMGRTTPLYHWMRAVLVPIRIFRYPQRTLAIFQLAVAVLAAYGVAAAAQRIRIRRFPWATAVLTLAVALDLTLAHRFLVPLGDRRSWDSRPPVLDLLPPPDPAYRLDEAGTDAVDPSSVQTEADHLDLRNLLPPDYSMRFGYNSRSAHLSFDAPERYLQLSLSLIVSNVPEKPIESDRYLFTDAARRLFRIQSVRAFIGTAPVEADGWVPTGSVPFHRTFSTQKATFDPAHLVRDYNVRGPLPVSRPYDTEIVRSSIDSANVAQTDAALPRWRLVPFAFYEPDKNRALAMLRDGAVDPETTVVVESAMRAPAHPLTTGTVVPTTMDPNRLAFRTQSDGDGFFVLSDTNYPGWTATVDGRKVPIAMANYNFRAIALPAGEHRVEFRFWPAGFTAALVLGAVGLAAAATAILEPRRIRLPVRRRRSSRG